MSECVKTKSTRQLLDELGKVAQPGSVVHEQQKMAVLVSSVEDLQHALHELGRQLSRSATTNDSLARKVYWLNVVLTVATVVGAVAALVQVVK